jgi:APA family basic amino acid/polyamine antiporter
MAKKHWLPSFLSKEGRRNTPGNALFFQALWASLLVFTGSYSDLLVYATFCSLVFYIITITGLFRLRKTQGHLVRTYQCPGYPVIPLLYIVITGMVCVSLLVTQTRNSLTGLIFPVVAMLVYRFLPERAKITA